MLEIWHLFKNAVILIEMLIAVFAVIFFHLFARKPNLEKKIYLFKQILL